MFKKKLIIISVGLLMPLSEAFSQYAEDAILFSRHFVNGTARMQGIGGAQVALGGDITNAAINPAGLGLFNRNELTISPALNVFNTTSDYQGTRNHQLGTYFNFANIGIVFNNTHDDWTGPWRGGSFGINFSRLNHYRNELMMQGTSAGSSVLDHFAETLHGINPANLSDQIHPPLSVYAYEQFLIDEVGNNVYIAALGENDIPFQRDHIITRGAQNQWNFSYGGNFNDRIYLGAGLGITRLNFTRERLLREEFPLQTGNQDMVIQDVEVFEDLRIRGTGLNLNLGAIFRPTDHMRFGFSLITPTFYALTEDYIASLYSMALVEGSPDFEEHSTPSFRTYYNLNTPLRLNGGFAYFFEKSGFISADVEYLNYANTRLSSFDFDMTPDNQEINRLAGSAVNLRIGGEYRIDQYRLRAGFAHYGDPFNLDDINRSRNIMSVGGGIRTSTYFVDLALIHSFMRDLHYPYLVEGFPQPVANVNNMISSLVVTVGFNF